MTIGVLTATLVALLARTLLDGLSLAGGLADGVIALLLLTALGLWRQGRQLASHPDSPHSSSPGSESQPAG